MYLSLFIDMLVFMDIFNKIKLCYISPALPIVGSFPALPTVGAVPARPVEGSLPARPIDVSLPARPVVGSRPARPVVGSFPARPVGCSSVFILLTLLFASLNALLFTHFVVYSPNLR